MKTTLLAAAATLGLGLHAAHAQPALHLDVAGPPVTVFHKASSGCDADDIPDAPARAIRTADGQVQLYATQFKNRLWVGPDLLHLSHPCGIVYSGKLQDDPARYDDHSWLASPWTPDGRTVYAIIHNEFWGYKRPGLCPTGRYIDCWYNALVMAVSHDAGRSFQRPADALVATLPYRYDQAVGEHRGYFNPSNIVEYGGALYMFTFTTDAFAQKHGNCLLRTDNIAQPENWRAWDGSGFNVRFVNPYWYAANHQEFDPAKHVCTPVGAGKLRWPVTSLVRHATSGLYVAVMLNGAHDGGVFYATSRDLVTWSDPAELLPAMAEGAYKCGDQPPVFYPSLLDPASPDRNFQTFGKNPWLFLTRFNIANCKVGMDRDLVAIPLQAN